MSDNKSVSHIPVLTGSTNYRAWWIKVDSYADLHGFSAAYKGTNTPADQANPTSVETAGLRELKAKGLLKSTVSDIIAQCQECYQKFVLFAQFLLILITYELLSYSVCLHCANFHTPLPFLFIFMTSEHQDKASRSIWCCPW